MTTVQRDALTAVDGMILYDSALAQVQGRVAGVWVDLGGAGGGGLSHSLFGGYFPGVLSTGIKTTPQVEYRGDAWTLTKLSCRVAVVPQGAAITVQFRKNGANIGTAVSIAIVANAGEVTGLSIAVADKDYFDIEITQVGTAPNEGSDLVWQGLP